MADDLEADFLAREQAILGADAALFNVDSAPIAVDSNAQNDLLFGDFEAPVAANDTVPSSVAALANAPVEIEVESEAVKAWRESFAAIIAERDARSQKKHAEVLATAKDSLERFYAEYNDKKHKAVAKNKEAEAQLVNRDEAAGSGNIWERVVRQVELSATTTSVNPARDTKKPKDSGQKDDKAAKKPSTKLKDTSRFKTLLLSLKNDKAAPGNAVAV
ncbi:hypothetical protein HDU97_007670 [Phlyctochytrium planicorne]|nr:hypothetical protein HDU97_007670 [Phlyctochytrium planicorne]